MTIKSVFVVTGLAGLIGCTPTTNLVNRTESTAFTTPARVRRVDGGWSNEENKTRITGYVQQALSKPREVEYHTVRRDSSTGWFNNDVTLTTTTYRSNSTEPAYSLGAEITHSLSKSVGIGGHFDAALGNGEFYRREGNGNGFSSCQVGFYCRLTKNSSIVTVAWRPEISVGFLAGHIAITEEGESSYTEDAGRFQNGFFSFRQSLALRLDPIDMIGVFGELQHATLADNYVDEWLRSHNTFCAIVGVSVTLFDLVNVTPSYAIPILQNFFGTDYAHSVGVSTSLIF